MQEKDIISAQAKTVVSALAEAGVDIPLGTAYNAVSRLCGSKDWNALSARLRASAPGAKKVRFSDELATIRDALEAAEHALEKVRDASNAFSISVGGHGGFSAAGGAGGGGVTAGVATGGRGVAGKAAYAGGGGVGHHGTIPWQAGHASSNGGNGGGGGAMSGAQQLAGNALLSLRERALPLVRAMLANERAIRSSAPRLLVLPSSDDPVYDEYALIPANVDAEHVLAEFTTWLTERRTRDSESNGEDGYMNTDVQNKLHELGCNPFSSTEKGPVWD
jgi:hypothetical protein